VIAKRILFVSAAIDANGKPVIQLNRQLLLFHPIMQLTVTVWAKGHGVRYRVRATITQPLYMVDFKRWRPIIFAKKIGLLTSD